MFNNNKSTNTYNTYIGFTTTTLSRRLAYPLSDNRSIKLHITNQHNKRHNKSNKSLTIKQKYNISSTIKTSKKIHEPLCVTKNSGPITSYQIHEQIYLMFNYIKK